MESSYLGASPAYGVFQSQLIIGDGSTTEFDLDYPVSTSTQILVSFAGVIQEPEYSYTSYTVSGQGKVFFSEPLDSGGRCFIIYMGRQLLVPTVADNSVTNDKLNLSYVTPTTHTGDGSTTIFEISSGYDVNSVLVFVNGLCNIPTTDYTISGTDLTFTTAPTNSSTIIVRYLPI